jgi:hypothetical protein
MSHESINLNPPSTPTTAQVGRLKDLEAASPLLNPIVSPKHRRLIDPTFDQQQPVAGHDEI